MVYVQHFKSVFEELWKTGTDPSQRIRDIKQGLDPEVIETIEKPAMVQELFFNILRSAWGGIISVCMEIKRRDISNEVIVSVKDSGNGINPSIFPRVFSKFATNSPKGNWIRIVYLKKYHRSSWW